MPVVDQSSPVTDVQQAVPVAGEMDDAAFVTDLAARLFRGVTPAMGFDQGDTDRLHRIARGLTEPARKADRLEGDREAIARIIDPNGWDHADFRAARGFEPNVRHTRPSLITADRILAAISDPTHTREAEGVTVAEYNEVYDKFEEVVGGAFREGFREGWVFAQTPDGTDYDDRQEEYGRTVDIEPSEAWEGYRDKYEAMLPVPALPALNARGAA
jgi:hypothetical protein